MAGVLAVLCCKFKYKQVNCSNAENNSLIVLYFFIRIKYAVAFYDKLGYNIFSRKDGGCNAEY